MVGDVLSMDTASITGEPLPRDYPSEQYGALILTGTTVKAGEAYCVVRKTGINTEVRECRQQSKRHELRRLYLHYGITTLMKGWWGYGRHHGGQDKDKNITI